ncbi:MAG: ATP-binding protein [Acinetobacter populi]|jgi:predicted ATPase|uniref:AAA family ATPase n=1 Tax=Acinetobacter populi TaxID=1582270 RepID=UPI0023547C6F|nr:AAA family ATPase [Acinetobacter populi]MCH4247895.1 ATP-binding protein [Acinetobacter populi]
MKLVLENIGLLQKAEIDLNHLTVIAGENDNGKSTIGKVIFCVIKAMSRYREDLQESKEYKINEKLERLFFIFRRVLSASSTNVDLVQQFQKLMNTNKSSSSFLQLFDELLSQLEEQAKDFESEEWSKFKAIQNDIKQILDTPENKIHSIERALNKAFSAEFDRNILRTHHHKGFIKIYENELVLFELEVQKDDQIKLLREPEAIEIKDVTFIETPLILNYYDLLIRSQSGFDAKKRSLSRLGIPYTTLHTKDLFDKLKERNILGEFTLDDININPQIEEIIEGNISYDNEKQDFIFIKDEERISIKNTASGIKSFGLLQLLASNGFINKNAMLVFDEPENHLHPKWQLKFAEILVQLASQGVHILISSHSPYMIEALKRYSERFEIETEPRFYLAKDKIIDNENRLSEIFEALSEPFAIFRGMDAEELKGE